MAKFFMFISEFSKRKLPVFASQSATDCSKRSSGSPIDQLVRLSFTPNSVAAARFPLMGLSVPDPLAVEAG